MTMNSKDQKTWDESKFHLSGPEPKSLLTTIERIKELRAVADKEAADCDYDPHNYTADLCRVFRAKADTLEADMEHRIGWN
jgi:hypothetical protein